MLSNEEQAYLSAREFSRVDAFVPMDVRPVPEGKKDGFRSKVSQEAYLIDFSVPQDVEDTALSNWLKMLNAKMDFIIDYLQLRHEDYSNLPYRHINLSAGGMAFTSNETYRPGTLLEIKMTLHVHTAVALCIYGEVIKSEKKGQEFKTAVKFIFIDDEVRDELVRFVFERQRQVLREKRKS